MVGSDQEMLAIDNESCVKSDNLTPKWIQVDFFIWFSPCGCRPNEMGSNIDSNFTPSCTHTSWFNTSHPALHSLYPNSYTGSILLLKLAPGFALRSWPCRTKMKFMKLASVSTWKPSLYLCKFPISLEIFYFAFWLEFLRRQNNLAVKTEELLL